MNTEEKANELYPNNKTFCGGVAQIARDAFAKGARMQKEVDDKELSEKVSAAYQLGLADKEKQMMKEAVEGDIGMTLHDKRADLYVRSKGYLPESLGIKCNNKIRIIIVKEEENGTE